MGFSMFFRFLEGILMEHIDMKSSLDSKLQVCCTCSSRIPSRNRDIAKNGTAYKTDEYQIYKNIIYE